MSVPLNPAFPSQPRDDGQAIWIGPAQAERRLVLLHGWGADADDLLDLGEVLLQDGELRGDATAPETTAAADGVSVVALRAPEPHPYGTGRQWYDLQPLDWAALPAARAALRGRLEGLAGSVPLQRTVLLGFSQGGAMALDVGSGLPLAGIVACSGYPHEGWQPAGSLPPVLLSHGRQDPVVPFAASLELQRLLGQAGARVQLLPFEGGHGIDPQLLPAVATFVRGCLGLMD
jgi:phospholipase/carboxylesterase